IPTMWLSLIQSNDPGSVGPVGGVSNAKLAHRAHRGALVKLCGAAAPGRLWSARRSAAAPQSVTVHQAGRWRADRVRSTAFAAFDGVLSICESRPERGRTGPMPV